MPAAVVVRLLACVLLVGCGSDPAAMKPMPDAPVATRAFTCRIFGDGTVVRQDTGQRCRGGCTWTFSELTALDLEASPDPGWQLDGWTGPCQSQNADIQVVVDQPTTCDVHFSQLPIDAAEEDAPDVTDAGVD